MSANRVILRHHDQESPIEMVMNLARRGAWCSFDLIGEADSAADLERAHRLVTLFERGFGDRMLISQDGARWSPAGAASDSTRLTYLLEWFTLTLMDAGATAEMIRSMLVDNPRQAMSIVAPEGQ